MVRPWVGLELELEMKVEAEMVAVFFVQALSKRAVSSLRILIHIVTMVYYWGRVRISDDTGCT